MDLADRRQMNRGMGDALAKAFELMATPLLFGAAGWFLDRWLQTMPLFTLVLALLAVIGKLLAMWYRYVAKMEQLEAELPSRAPASVAAAPWSAAFASPASGAGPVPAPPPPGHLPTGVTLDPQRGSA
jgi:F0F1-type ATP synthase assembly protein I